MNKHHAVYAQQCTADKDKLAISIPVDTVLIIQVYMPTLTDNAIEELYEQTENILEESKNMSTVVMGDFNALKVNINEYIGKHGLGN